MAEFTGDIAEFTKYIGGYTRNKVQYISSKYRKKIAKCEHCGSRTKHLDAAHIKGNSRPEIIKNILSDHIDENKIKINLDEFEEKFLKAHEPLNEKIKILCKECHNEYDKKEKIITLDDVGYTTEVDEINETNFISNSINNDKINKRKAIHILKEEGIVNESNCKNIVFSNVNKSVDVWWIEPENSKFKEDLLILLNNESKSELLVVLIPKNTITNVQNIFDQRKDKNYSKIIININDKTLSDNRGFSFKPYTLKLIKY